MEEVGRGPGVGGAEGGTGGGAGARPQIFHVAALAGTGAGWREASKPVGALELDAALGALAGPRRPRRGR